MDFTTLKRKELQALCKEHGIPANLTNLEMAKQLTTLLKGKQQKTTRSCLRNFENDVVDVDDENKVEGKEGKRVRFSPHNETFEFEKTDPRECRLLARKRRAMAKSEIEADPVLVAESVSGVEESEVGKNPKRNSRRRTMVNPRPEDSNPVDVGLVQKPVERNLRRKSMAVLVSQDVSNVETEAEKGDSERNVRRRSMVKSDVVLVSQEVGKFEKPAEGENQGRNLRSRGRKTMQDEEEKALFSPCVEKRTRRGRKGSRAVEEGCVDGVDNTVIDEIGNDMVVTRRNLRSREVRDENSGKGDDGLVGITENNSFLKEGFNEKSENDMQVARRSTRQTDKGKARNNALVGKGQGNDDVSNQNFANNQSQGLVEVALGNVKRTRAGKKTSDGRKLQEVKEVSYGGVDKLNINVEKPEESNAYVGRTGRGKEAVAKDLQEGNEDVKVLEKKRGRRRNRIVEEDCTSKEMPIAKRSTRLGGLTKVDASLIEPVLDDTVPQSNDRVDKGEKERFELVNQISEPNDCSMDKVDDVGTDHTSNAEPISGGATLDDSVPESKKSEVEEQNHATGGAVSVEQKQQKCEGDKQISVNSPLNLSMVDDTAKTDDYKELKDGEEKTLEFVQTNVQSSSKNESPAPSLLQDSDSYEAKSAAQTNNREIPLKVHVASSMSSQEEIVCKAPVINTETVDGTFFSPIAAENCVDVSEPVFGSIAKPTTPRSNKVLNINGEGSNIQNSVGNKTLKTVASAGLCKSNDHLIEQEEWSGSRESERMTSEISSVQRTDKSFLDEKINSKVNDQLSIGSDGLASAFAASVAAVHKPVEESVDNETATPKQNLEVGSSCSNYKESKVVESQTTDSSEDLSEPMAFNISFLFAQSQVDEQCHANEEKSEPEDVTEPICGSITNPTSPRSSKVIDIDCERLNMENTVGNKILDISDDQQIEKEGAAGSRGICDNIFRESECQTTDISYAQRLDQCILDEKIEVVSEATVKENVQPSVIYDGSTPVSPASVAAVHKLMEESVDTGTITPPQNLGVGFSCSNNEEPKVVDCQTTDSCEAISGSSTINISSLFVQSPVKEQCQVNEYYILTKKEENSEETVQLSEKNSLHSNIVYDKRKSEELTESNNSEQKATEDVETNAESPANNESIAPSLLHNGSDDDAKSSMKTSSDLKISTELHVAAGNNCHEEIVSTPLSISTRKFNGTPFSSVAPEHSIDRASCADTSKSICSSSAIFTIPDSSKVINGDDELSCQKFESGRGAKNSCQSSNDQLSKLDPRLEGAFAKFENAIENKLLDSAAMFEKLDDRVVEQGEAPGSRESFDSISKEAEYTTHEVLNSKGLTDETNVQPPIAVDRLNPYSEVSLHKPMEEVEETKTVTPQQSQEDEFRSISTEARDVVDSQAKYHSEDMLDSFSNISTSWLFVHSQVGDEPTVIQGSLKKREKSDKEAQRDLSCFDNITKLDYLVEDDKFLDAEQPEDGQKFMDAKLQHSDFEDDMTNSDSKEVASKNAAGVTEENGHQGDNAVLLQDRKSNEVPSETNRFPNEVNVFSPALSGKTEDVQACTVRVAEVLKDDVVFHVDYSTKSTQDKDIEPSKASFLVDTISSTVKSKKDDDSEGNSIMESIAFGDKPDILVKDDHESIGGKLMWGCSIAANNSVAGSCADDSAVECAFGLEYWSETLQNTSEDKSDNTLHTASPADDNGLYLGEYMLHEYNQDVEGDEVKSMDKADSLFLESAMVVETKPEILTHDISESSSDKNLTEVSVRQTGSSDIHKDVGCEGIKAHCGEDLARMKDIIHPAMVETQLLGDNVKESDKSKGAALDAADMICLLTPNSGRAWKDHVAEKKSEQSEVNDSENVCMTESDILASERREYLQSSCEVAEVSDVTNGDSGKLSMMEFTGDEGNNTIGQPHMHKVRLHSQVYPKQEAACNTGNEHLPETLGDLQGSPWGVDKMAIAPEQIDDGPNGILAFNVNTEDVDVDKGMDVKCNVENGLNVDPVEKGVDSLETVLVEAKEHSAGVAPDDHPFINMLENNEMLSNATEDKHLDSVDNSVGPSDCFVILGEGEHGKVGSEECHKECQILEHSPNHCDVGTESGSVGKDSTDELSNKAGSFSWRNAFEEVANQLQENNTSPSSASITALQETEENKDQKNNIEGCMFNKWEIDLIYGEMIEEEDELRVGSSEKSLTKNKDEGANTNGNPIKPQQQQGQLVQDQVSVLKVAANSSEVNPDRKHGKINETSKDDIGDTDENKVVKSSSMMKRNVNRSILIHGTPKKPILFTHDMKENATTAKTLKMVDVTAVKPIVKRKALGDLGK